MDVHWYDLREKTWLESRYAAVEKLGFRAFEGGIFVVTRDTFNGDDEADPHGQTEFKSDGERRTHPSHAHLIYSNAPAAFFRQLCVANADATFKCLPTLVRTGDANGGAPRAAQNADGQGA